MSSDPKATVHSTLMLMRDHARARLIDYATRHRMRPTGWHFMIDASTGGSVISESGLVIMQCTGARYYCIRITVDAETAAAPVNVSGLEILSLDSERVAHLIFNRDGWTETRAVKKQSDKIVENAMPAPDKLDDE